MLSRPDFEVEIADLVERWQGQPSPRCSGTPKSALQQRYRDQPRGLRSSPTGDNGIRSSLCAMIRAKSVHYDARPIGAPVGAGTNERTNPLPGYLVMIELFEDEAIASGVNE
jgi:hypothetical protein